MSAWDRYAAHRRAMWRETWILAANSVGLGFAVLAEIEWAAVVESLICLAMALLLVRSWWLSEVAFEAAQEELKRRSCAARNFLN